MYQWRYAIIQAKAEPDTCYPHSNKNYDVYPTKHAEIVCFQRLVEWLKFDKEEWDIIFAEGDARNFVGNVQNWTRKKESDPAKKLAKDFKVEHWIEKDQKYVDMANARWSME